MQTTKLELVSELIKQNVSYKKKCLCENTLYDADINLENSQNKISYSISERKFKTGYANHKQSIKHQRHKNDMQLTSELGKIKSTNKEPVIVWKMLGQYQSYCIYTKLSLQWSNEKLRIAIYWGNNVTNKHTEIISK